LTEVIVSVVDWNPGAERVTVMLSPGLRLGRNQAFAQPASPSGVLHTGDDAVPPSGSVSSRIAWQTGAPVAALVIGMAEAGHVGLTSQAPCPQAGSVAHGSKAHELHASTRVGTANRQRSGEDRRFMQVPAGACGTRHTHAEDACWSGPSCAGER
jgi:hypothetical protein